MVNRIGHVSNLMMISFLCSILFEAPFLENRIIRIGQFNPYLTNGFSHHYHLGESTISFRGVRSDFIFYLIFR